MCVCVTNMFVSSQLLLLYLFAHSSHSLLFQSFRGSIEIKSCVFDNFTSFERICDLQFSECTIISRGTYLYVCFPCWARHWRSSSPIANTNCVHSVCVCVCSCVTFMTCELGQAMHCEWRDIWLAFAVYKGSLGVPKWMVAHIVCTQPVCVCVRERIIWQTNWTKYKNPN